MTLRQCLIITLAVGITGNSLALGTFIPTANASTVSRNVTAAHVDDLVLSGCGTQDIYFSGTASYGILGTQLVVTVDSSPVLQRSGNTLEGTILWLTSAVTLSSGQHFVSAAVMDASGVTRASHGFFFTVASCPQPLAPQNSGGGDGDEQDCCPGPDEPLPTNPAPRTPLVRGTSIALNSTLVKLGPLNSIFRSVYHRDPTFNEWHYWANRYLTDKSSWEALLGAMQWHLINGRNH